MFVTVEQSLISAHNILLLEYCENGSLLQYLIHHREDITKVEESQSIEPAMHDEDQAESSESRILKLSDLVEFSYQICRGLMFLHRSQIIHRDLSARNILLDHNLVAKISDFGLAVKTDIPVTVNCDWKTNVNRKTYNVVLIFARYL